MAQLTIVYWRDIPAQVIVKAGRRNAKRQLSERFEKAIDRAAMRAGMDGTDDYLSEWRRAAPVDCGDDLEAEADAAARRLEEAYDPDRLRRLVSASGRAEDAGAEDAGAEDAGAEDAGAEGAGTER